MKSPWTLKEMWNMTITLLNGKNEVGFMRQSQSHDCPLVQNYCSQWDHSSFHSIPGMRLCLSCLMNCKKRTSSWTSSETTWRKWWATFEVHHGSFKHVANKSAGKHSSPFSNNLTPARIWIFSDCLVSIMSNGAIESMKVLSSCSTNSLPKPTPNILILFTEINRQGRKTYRSLLWLWKSKASRLQSPNITRNLLNPRWNFWKHWRSPLQPRLWSCPTRLLIGSKLLPNLVMRTHHKRTSLEK